MARPLKPCGTEAAYQRHRRRGEDACERCTIANREASKLRGREYYKRKRAAAAKARA